MTVRSGRKEPESAYDKPAAGTGRERARGRLPYWMLSVFQARGSDQSLVALRQRAEGAPDVLASVVTEIEVWAGDDPKGEREQRCSLAWSQILLCWLTKSPERKRAGSHFDGRFAERNGDIETAAKALLSALNRYEGVEARAHQEGVIPVEVPSWYPYDLRFPELRNTLEELQRVAERAKNRCGRGKPKGHSASAASFLRELDSIGSVQLSNEAFCDLWAYFTGQVVTPDALRKARTRQLENHG